jgi:hypothetical protein
MNPDTLALQVSSGILLAAMVMFLARAAINAFIRRDLEVAIPCALFSLVIAAPLVLGGLGIVQW